VHWLRSLQGSDGMNEDLTLNPTPLGPRRRFKKTPIILGLTGSIGMGKSTIGSYFKSENYPYWSSDEAVHSLYRRSKPLKAAIIKTFGIDLIDNRIDRNSLTTVLQKTPDGFDILNRLVHPLVKSSRERFLTRNRNANLVVLDIPLLLELGLEREVHKVLVVSCPFEIQKSRVLKREGMSEEKFLTLLKRQMPDGEKQKRADYVIDTQYTIESNQKSVKKIINILLSKAI
jgi:dephospho-CoA kinase